MAATPGQASPSHLADRAAPRSAPPVDVSSHVFGAPVAGNPVDWTEDEISGVIEDHALHRGHSTVASGVPNAVVTDLPTSGHGYLSDALAADGGLVVQIDETTRLVGWEQVALLSRRELTVRADPSGRLQVVHDRPVGGGDLWDLTGLRGVRSDRALVLGNVDDDSLTALSRIGTSAVAQASGFWGSRWDRRLVIVAPGTLEEFADQLGEAPTTARGFAAVTSGHAAYNGPQEPPVGQFVGSRINVNPDAWQALTERGRLFVLSHEATHVAAQGASGPRPPDWLAEGVADEVGLRASGLGAAAFEQPLLDEVRKSGAPGALPGDEDFTGDDANVGARAYAGADVAVLLIERTYGRSALRAFFRDATALVREGRPASRALAAAMRDDLGTTPAAFTKAWRAELRRLVAH
jgi:hypothetical protein